MFQYRPTKAEHREFNHAPIQFALWPNSTTLWPTFKSSTLDRTDDPYPVHLPHPDTHHMPPLLSREERYPIIMLLMNAQGGNIAALRVATIIPETSSQTRSTIEQQKPEPFNPETYHRSLQETMTTLKTTDIVRPAGRIDILGQEPRNQLHKAQNPSWGQAVVIKSETQTIAGRRQPRPQQAPLAAPHPDR